MASSSRFVSVSPIGVHPNSRRIPLPADPAEESEAHQKFGVLFDLAKVVIVSRLAHGWSQQQLARRMRVQQSRISDIESGKGNPSVDTIQRLATQLEFEVAFRAWHPPDELKRPSRPAR